MNAPISVLSAGPSKAGVRVFWVGLFLQFSMVIGLAGTVLGMHKAFAVLGKDSTVGDPAGLSAAIGQVLESTVVGFAGNNLGVLVCLFALWHYHLRSRWMFWTSIVLGILIAPVGLCLLVYCLVQRHEFFGQPSFRSAKMAFH